MPNRATATVLAAVTVLAVFAGHLAAQALWRAETALAPITVTAGNLNLVLDGPAKVTARGEPAASLVVLHPGDQVVTTQPVAVTKVGDNLAASINARMPTTEWDNTYTATFRIETETGQRLAPEQGDAPMGTTLILPHLPAGVTRLNVVATVTKNDPYRWSSNGYDASHPYTTVGQLQTRAVQTRTGHDFTANLDPEGLWRSPTRTTSATR